MNKNLTLLTILLVAMMSLLLTNCKEETTEPEYNPYALVGTWTFKEYVHPDGGAISPPVLAWITFAEDGSIEGATTVPTSSEEYGYMGGFSVSNIGTLTIWYKLREEVTSPDAVVTFANNVKLAKRYHISDDTLTLMCSTGEQMIFTRITHILY